jgi:hypothetical protein
VSKCSVFRTGCCQQLVGALVSVSVSETENLGMALNPANSLVLASATFNEIQTLCAKYGAPAPTHHAYIHNSHIDSMHLSEGSWSQSMADPIIDWQRGSGRGR